MPLCGKSRDMLWLLGQGCLVLGVEISPLAVKAFFDENDLEPQVSREGAFECWRSGELTILCGDFFDLAPEQLEGVAGVYDRASLVALPPPMRERYAGHLAAILPPAVATLLVTLDYPQREMDGPPFAVSEEEVHRLFDPRFEVAHLFTQDMLAENPQFRARGLTRFIEQVYRLQPR